MEKIVDKNTDTVSMLSEAAMCAWLGAAAPGDRLAYHRGFLAIDCDSASSRLPERDRLVLRRLAARATFAAHHRLVFVVQRRNGPGDYTYLLIARRRAKVTGSAAISGR